MTEEEALRELRYAARRFQEARRGDFPVRVTNRRYHRVYRAMRWCKEAAVLAGEINRLLREAECL